MDAEKYKQLHDILYTHLFIGVPASEDLGDKVGLIMMICYLKHALEAKKPDITHAEVIKLCMPKEDELWVDQENLDILALMCDWFSYDCKKFPNLGLKAKDMPEKIREQLSKLCPF